MRVDLLLTPRLPVADVANSMLQVVSVCSSATVTVVAMSAVPVRSPVIAVMFAASAYIPCHLTEVVPKSYVLSAAGFKSLVVEVVATKLPVTSPVSDAVITLAAKSPEPSRRTRLFDALVDAEATLIVVSPDTPSALVRVIPDDAVACRVR